jgi:hypothetical protein
MGVIINPVAYDDWEWMSGAVLGPTPTTASIEDINSTGVYSWSFTDGEALLFLPRQIPHTYKVGTDLIPHIHWCASTTATYTGTWTLETVSWLTVTGAQQSKVTVTQAFDFSATAWTSVIADFNAVLTGTGRDISSVIAAKLSLALSAGTRCHLLGLDAHYQNDGFGSVSPTSKA